MPDLIARLDESAGVVWIGSPHGVAPDLWQHLRERDGCSRYQARPGWCRFDREHGEHAVAWLRSNGWDVETTRTSDLLPRSWPLDCSGCGQPYTQATAFGRSTCHACGATPLVLVHPDTT